MIYKKLLITIVLLLFLANPVFGAEVKGTLQGFVISADRNQQIAEIQIQINRIMALIVQLTRELNELLKAK